MYPTMEGYAMDNETFWGIVPSYNFLYASIVPAFNHFLILLSNFEIKLNFDDNLLTYQMT